MNPLSIYLSQRSLQRSQWFDRKAIRSLQEDKLKHLIDYAYQHVPYYRTLFNEINLNPGDINSLDDLNKIPVTTKADLQAIPAVERISDRFSMGELATEHSSGSTGQPFTAYFDKDFVTTRNNMFLRALRAMGYKPGQKLMLITAGHNRTRPWLRWHYASIESSADNLLKQLKKFRPSVLYGCATSLRLMALYARKSGIKPHQPKTVISTAETLDQGTRTLLKETFGASVYDLYGLTEMGLVAWECPAQEGYHLSEDTTIIEFEHDKYYQSNRLIMTNLELKAMPLIRYQTGDLAKVADDIDCSCGRQLQRIDRIEGRIIDCITLSEDRAISPYRLTLALEKIAGLGHYQILQNDINRFTVRIERSGLDQTHLKGNVVSALEPILGSNIQYFIKFEDSLVPSSGKKFRVVENQIKA